DAADAELAVHAAGTPGQLAPAHDAGGELGLAPALGHLCLGRHFFSPAAGAAAAGAAAAASGLGSGLGRVALATMRGGPGSSGFLKGIPSCCSTKRERSGLELLKVMLMFMPWVNSTSAMLISGNTPCSERPMA